jgi:hypothetical protein
MSARSDAEIALDILGAAVLLGPAVAKGIREVIEAMRPDIKLADPPPGSQHAAILAEDEETIARRFGGRTTGGDGT